ncbi:hypothetical protein FNF28_03562 [Cafeteria roenbergensis]|uniref:N-acetyltransferase domain-containing protein n=1 Tax=Cafeteria roenbergensis TaxID=33653 RepID=A0A5A8DI29_CAFRO|nr:hypothetical protein FNF28_03562 [Cafeteria roenbergensis]
MAAEEEWGNAHDESAFDAPCIQPDHGHMRRMERALDRARHGEAAAGAKTWRVRARGAMSASDRLARAEAEGLSSLGRQLQHANQLGAEAEAAAVAGTGTACMCAWDVVRLLCCGIMPGWTADVDEGEMELDDDAYVGGGGGGFGPIHKNNVGAVERLVHTVLPVVYSKGFYETLMATPEAFTHACYYNNLFVGVVGCRPERRPDGKQRLYVAVLGVLAAYRGRGLGTKLLQSVIDAVPSHDDVVEVYLHVHTANPRAVALYEKVGFENVGVIKGYYSAAALTPPDCVLLRKVFGDAEPSVSIEHGGLGAPAPVAAEDA